MTTLRRHGILAIALVGLVAAGATAWFRLGVTIDAQRPVGHAYRVLAEIGRLGNLVDQADLAQRAYLGEQDPAAYQLYRDTTAGLDRTLASVRALTGADPVHQRILAEIRTVEAEARGGPAGLRGERFGRFAALVGAMHDHEARVLDGLLRDGTASARDARRLIVAVAAGAALLVAAAWWATRRAGPAGGTAAGAAAAGRADVERHLAATAEAESEVRGALAGTG